MDKETWDKTYKEAKEITDVGWESGEPTPELVQVVEEGTVPPSRALDIGCGYGTNALFLAKKGFTVVGVDISPHALEVARHRARDAGVTIDFREQDVTTTPVTGAFGLVVDRGCFHILERQDRARYIQQLYEILQPEGWLYLEVFADTNPRSDEGPSQFSEQEIRQLFYQFRVHSLQPVTFTDEESKERFTLHALLFQKPAT